MIRHGVPSFGANHSVFLEQNSEEENTVWSKVYYQLKLTSTLIK